MTRPDPVDQAQRTPLRFSRRGIVVAGVALLATGGAVAAQWYNILAENGSQTLTPQDAYAAASNGVLLIDIRRPDEWARTGVGEHAIPIDMRRADFETELLKAAGGDTTRPIALICARGVRSRRMTARLTEAGFSRIIDVPEGMLGSGAGPGWVKRGLPVVTYSK